MLKNTQSHTISSTRTRMGEKSFETSRWFCTAKIVFEIAREAIEVLRMTDDQEPVVPQFEMEITLPTILEDPVRLQDGTVLQVGDSVEYPEIGVGKILRIWCYESIGTCLYIDFGGGVKEEIHPDFVRKVADQK